MSWNHWEGVAGPLLLTCDLFNTLELPISALNLVPQELIPKMMWVEFSVIPGPQKHQQGLTDVIKIPIPKTAMR